MLKGRGFPLCSFIRLPIPYRAKGVSTGDVHIATAFDGSDFLFNICQAPINFPIIFASAHPLTDVREFHEFSSGSYLASSSIVGSQTAEQTYGICFSFFFSPYFITVS